MFLDFLNSALSIEDSPPQLRPHQVSQICFFGFTKISGSSVYKREHNEANDIPLKLRNYFDQEGISYNLSASYQKLLSDLDDLAALVEQSKTIGQQFKEGHYDFLQFEAFRSFVEKKIPRSLKNHQLKAAYHLYLVGNGANFSVPGSGKTAVILTVYEKLRLEGKVNMLYVIGPPACFGPWRTEFNLTLGRDPEYRIFAGGQLEQRKSEYYGIANQTTELYLTTFQTLLNDQTDVIAFLDQPNNKTFLVVDEAHYIKQIGGNWSNAVLRCSEHAKFRCTLTGTPMPKSYTDIFNLFDFLWPRKGPLDPEAKYRIEIDEEKNNVASVKEVLKQNIGPLFYRVRKSDLGLTTPIFHPTHLISMNEYERGIYNAIRDKIVGYTEQDYLKNIEIVKKLRRCRIIRLRQCTSYVKLLSTALKGYKENLFSEESDIAKMIYDYDTLETPAKIEYLVKFVGDLQKMRLKVIVWAHFIGTLKLVEKHFKKAGLICKLIYGETPFENDSVKDEETREQIRNEFIDPNSGLDILVANPAACGESISLHKTCHHAIYYDLSYNCAQYLQSLDRIHRVGGSEINEANYHFLQYENTLEQDIKSNLDMKASKMQDIIDQDYSIYSLDMFEQDEDLQAYERLFKRQ